MFFDISGKGRILLGVSRGQDYFYHWSGESQDCGCCNQHIIASGPRHIPEWMVGHNKSHMDVQSRFGYLRSLFASRIFQRTIGSAAPRWFGTQVRPGVSGAELDQGRSMDCAMPAPGVLNPQDMHLTDHRDSQMARSPG